MKSSSKAVFVIICLVSGMLGMSAGADAKGDVSIEYENLAASAAKYLRIGADWNERHVHPGNYGGDNFNFAWPRTFDFYKMREFGKNHRRLEALEEQADAVTPNMVLNTLAWTFSENRIKPWKAHSGPVDTNLLMRLISRANTEELIKGPILAGLIAISSEIDSGLIDSFMTKGADLNEVFKQADVTPVEAAALNLNTSRLIKLLTAGACIARVKQGGVVTILDRLGTFRQGLVREWEEQDGFAGCPACRGPNRRRLDAVTRIEDLLMRYLAAGHC